MINSWNDEQTVVVDLPSREDVEGLLPTEVVRQVPVDGCELVCNVVFEGHDDPGSWHDPPCGEDNRFVIRAWLHIDSFIDFDLNLPADVETLNAIETFAWPCIEDHDEYIPQTARYS